MTRPVVIVPRRADGGRRDEVWSWVRDRWARELPDWPIIEGHDDHDGPFNRSRAVNRAAAEAGDWTMAVIADSDSFVGTDQLIGAVNTAARTGLVTFAFTRFCYLKQEGSDRIMAGYQGSWERMIEWTLKGGCSSQVCMPREVWDAVGGMDEGFVGWGEEDIALSVASQTLAPRRRPAEPTRDLWELRFGFNRVPGDCWHLWHPLSETNDPDLPGYRANVARRERYIAAAHQPDAMEQLLTELGVGGRTPVAA
jgi:hypothetical protein